MISFCPKCNALIKNPGTYDKASDTMRYRCPNKACDYVHEEETIASKKKRMLRLTQKDKMLAQSEIAYTSEMSRRGR